MKSIEILQGPSPNGLPKLTLINMSRSQPKCLTNRGSLWGSSRYWKGKPRVFQGIRTHEINAQNHQTCWWMKSLIVFYPWYWSIASPKKSNIFRCRVAVASDHQASENFITLLDAVKLSLNVWALFFCMFFSYIQGSFIELTGDIGFDLKTKKNLTYLDYFLFLKVGIVGIHIMYKEHQYYIRIPTCLDQSRDHVTARFLLPVGLTRWTGHCSLEKQQPFQDPFENDAVKPLNPLNLK